MKRPPRSRLDPHAKTIGRLLDQDILPSEIVRILMRDHKVKITPTALGNWIDKNVKGKPIQVDVKRKQSLGILGPYGSDQCESNVISVLRVLFNYDSRLAKSWISEGFGPNGLDFPMRDEEIDVRKLAVTFGRERVESLGDLDFVLLALSSQEFRECRLKFADSGADSLRTLRVLVRCARDIRARMIEET